MGKIGKSVRGGGLVLVAVAIAIAVAAHVAVAQPTSCTTGNDPETGDPWVVCTADMNGAWISANNAGRYHAAQICQQLGYQGLGQSGGTCGNVCGYCGSPTSCSNRGSETFDAMADCGSDAFGTILCENVQWECVGPFTGSAARAPVLSPTWIGILAGLLAVVGIRAQRHRRT